MSSQQSLVKPYLAGFAGGATFWLLDKAGVLGFFGRQAMILGLFTISLPVQLLSGILVGRKKYAARGSHDAHTREGAHDRQPALNRQHSDSLTRTQSGRATLTPAEVDPSVSDGYEYKVFPDGSRFEGQWKDGLKHGKGRFIYPDGDVYDGEWLDGKAHGHGTYISKQSRYVGQWQCDLKHGQAVEEWDDTSKFTGSYSHGQKHGNGCFEWPDGSSYDGEFRNNNVEGEGTFVWKDGRKFTGQWVDNRMHGEGRYEWPDGRAYEGQYVNDLKEGEGTFLWADGRKFVGQWKDGKQHGIGVFRTAHGDQRTGEWREGVRVCWVDESRPQPDVMITLSRDDTDYCCTMLSGDQLTRVPVGMPIKEMRKQILGELPDKNVNLVLLDPSGAAFVPDVVAEPKADESETNDKAAELDGGSAKS